MLQEDLFPYSKKDWLNKQQAAGSVLPTGRTVWSMTHNPHSLLSCLLTTIFSQNPTVFTATLFLTAKGHNPNVHMINGNKRGYIHTSEYYLAIKKDKPLITNGCNGWLTLRCIVLRGESQSHKETRHMIPFICNNFRNRKQISGYQGFGVLRGADYEGAAWGYRLWGQNHSLS